MSASHSETCSACGCSYEVTPQNGKLYIFMMDWVANHFVAHCTSCRSQETIYLMPAVIKRLIEGKAFAVHVEAEPSDARREAALSAWRRALAVSGWSELPELPVTLRRQLHDDLRAWGKLP